MKKILVLILSFLALAMFFSACSDVTNITVPQDNSPLERVGYFYSFPWEGQGMDSMALDCDEEGYIHWVLNQAKDVPYAFLHLNVAGAGWYNEENKPINMYPPEEGSPTKGGVYHFYTPYFDLETLEAVVRYDTNTLGKNAQLVISEYCPGGDGSGILFEEDFTDVTTWSIPSGWTSTIFVPGQSNWNVTLMNNAGGSPPEMFFQWAPEFVGTSRLVSPVIDAGAVSGLSLEFKHFVDDFDDPAGAVYDLLVQVSTDGGSTWNTIWSITPTGNVGPETITKDLSAYDGQSFQVAWVLDGNSYGINYWYIDDIVVSY